MTVFINEKGANKADSLFRFAMIVEFSERGANGAPPIFSPSDDDLFPGYPTLSTGTHYE